MTDDNEMYCYYSDLPSPLAYEDVQETAALSATTATDTDSIVDMAPEDKTPLDALKYLVGLTESDR